MRQDGDAWRQTATRRLTGRFHLRPQEDKTEQPTITRVTGPASDRPAWARDRRPWDIAPGNWQYFVQGGIGLFLIAALITTIVRFVIGRPLDVMVLIVAGLIAGGLVGMQWFGTIQIAWRINRLARELPIARRTIPTRALVVGTVAIYLLMLAGLSGLLAYEDGLRWRGLDDPLPAGPLLALAATFGLFLLGRRTLSVLRRPGIVDQLVADSRDVTPIHPVDRAGLEIPPSR